MNKRNVRAGLLVMLLSMSLRPVAHAQVKEVLFLGNSYTQFNNLPELTRQFALAAGDTMMVQSNTPGGYKFLDHAANANSLNLIQSGSWDFVVLQEQSQLPAFPDGQFYAQSFPYALILDSLIHVANPCAHTLFYRTWGRKNGDPDNCGIFPPICTYAGMDSLLDLRYGAMAEATGAQISPVGDVWKYLRAHHPEIELYIADESHPSLAGSFAAAATFYTLVFGKDPTVSSYNAGLTPAIADIIRQAAKIVVWDSLSVHRQYDPMPQAAFTYEAAAGVVSFDNQSQWSDRWLWDFGDGQWAEMELPVHDYGSEGTYQVCLYAIRDDCDTSVFCQDVVAGPVSVAEMNKPVLVLHPNPALYTLEISGLNRACTFAVTTADGRQLMHGTLQPGKASIPVADVPAGMYLLHLYEQAGTVKVLKWVKK